MSCAWWGRYVAGLDMATGAVAWNRVRVRPEGALLPAHLAAQVPSAAIRIQTPHGAVGVSWAHTTQQRNGAPTLELNVTAPSSSTTEVHVPKLFGDRTVINARGLGGVGGVVLWGDASSALGSDVVFKFVGDDGRFIILSAPGGRHAFEVTSA